MLAHYNPALPISLAGDASAYGIGAVISHILPNGTEQPIAFASRTLSTSERNYAQIEKEALSLIFGVKKFHQYLYGRKFHLITDHKPLTAILRDKKGIPSLAAARLQRWAVLLSAYQYEITFKPTLQHANADGLSRLPLPTSPEDKPISSNDPTLFNITQIESLPLTAQQIEQATRNDKILSKVLQYTKRGWPSQEEDVMKPYCQCSEQITVEGDCLMWGYRVIIPSKHRSHILQELHRDHPGCSRMKSVARSFIWWPGLDKDIEELSKSCPSCQSIKNTPQPAPLHPWIWPTKPWQRIHIDFAGPFLDRHFLVVVDAHSKWPEVFEMPSTSTAKTIAVLRHLFAAYGLPEQVVSDNGPQFTAEEFKTFMKSNGVKHIRCAPYHPSSNGAAERFIQTFKRSMKASQKDGRTLSHRLADFLLTYRATTPHATTGQSPSTLFLQRHLRTRLSLLQPDTEKHVHQKQADQVKQHNTHAKQRSFRENQRVMVKNFRPGPKWVPGIIIKQLGPLSFLVRTSEDLEWKRHSDHIRDYTSDTVDIPPSTVTDSSEDPPDVDYYTRLTHEQQSTEQPSNTTRDDASDGNMEPRYPSRVRQQPDRFM